MVLQWECGIFIQSYYLIAGTGRVLLPVAYFKSYLRGFHMTRGLGVSLHMRLLCSLFVHSTPTGDK